MRREVERLRDIKPDLLLANIPYRLLLAARLAGIPAVALGSLNWAAIHAAYCGGDADGAAIRAQMYSGYAAADRFLTPAPALPMPELDNVHAIGPIARVGEIRREEILARMQRSADTRLVLVALGGIDSPLPLANWPRLGNVVWLFDRAPAGDRDDFVDFTRLPLPFIDLLASSDAVLTKPGYGTYAEAVCNGTPILTLARPDWPETPHLIAWARTHGRTRGDHARRIPARRLRRRAGDALVTTAAGRYSRALRHRPGRRPPARSVDVARIRPPGRRIRVTVAGHPWSAMSGFCVQLQPQCSDDFEDGVEVRAAFAGKCLV